MSFRFYRRLHVARWLRVNLSQSGPSLSFGVRGAPLTRSEPTFSNAEL